VAAKTDFEARLGQVDNTLNFLRDKTQEWNERLPQLVRSRIAEERNRIERARGVTLGYPMAPPKSAASETASPERSQARSNLAMSFSLTHLRIKTQLLDHFTLH
jgi:hypothetical protein